MFVAYTSLEKKRNVKRMLTRCIKSIKQVLNLKERTTKSGAQTFYSNCVISNLTGTDWFIDYKVAFVLKGKTLTNAISRVWILQTPFQILSVM